MEEIYKIKCKDYAALKWELDIKFLKYNFPLKSYDDVFYVFENIKINGQFAKIEPTENGLKVEIGPKKYIYFLEENGELQSNLHKDFRYGDLQEGHPLIWHLVHCKCDLEIGKNYE